MAVCEQIFNHLLQKHFNTEKFDALSEMKNVNRDLQTLNCANLPRILAQV